MEQRHRINEKLGEDNIRILLKEIEDGRVTEEQIQAMSLLMHCHCHGTFKENRGKIPLYRVTEKLLDEWFKESLHESDEGFSKLQDILRDSKVKLSYLAATMKAPCVKCPTCVDGQHSQRCDSSSSSLSSAYHTANLPQNEGRKDSNTDQDKETGESIRLLPNLNELPATKNSSKFSSRLLIGLAIMVVPSVCLMVVCIVSHISFCDSIDEQHGCTPPSSCNLQPEDTERFDKTNMTTRSVIVDKGIIFELHQCSTPQYPIPDLPAKVQKVVGIFVEHLGLLVCGGFIQKEDEEDQPRPDHPMLCYVHKLCSCDWKEYFKLNTNRIEAHIKKNGGKVTIFGGLSSHPLKRCYQSQEVLDVSNGWTEEPSIGRCLPGQESIIEVPCLRDCIPKCNTPLN